MFPFELLEHYKHALDQFLSPGKIYLVVRKAYTKRVYVDRDFQRKTNELVRNYVGVNLKEPEPTLVLIDNVTLEAIAARAEGKATKVINLVKAIEKSAEEQSDDPFLVAMAEIEKNSQRKKEQAEKGLDGLSYFVLCKLTDDGIANPEKVSGRIRGGV